MKRDPLKRPKTRNLNYLGHCIPIPSDFTESDLPVGCVCDLLAGRGIGRRHRGSVVGMVSRTHTIAANPHDGATTQMVVKMSVPSSAILDVLGGK